MAEVSRAVTAFRSPDVAAYQFRVMPLGLKNARGTFQLLLAPEVLTGYLHMFAIVYLDHIIIYFQRDLEP